MFKFLTGAAALALTATAAHADPGGGKGGGGDGGGKAHGGGKVHAVSHGGGHDKTKGGGGGGDKLRGGGHDRVVAAHGEAKGNKSDGPGKSAQAERGPKLERGNGRSGDDIQRGKDKGRSEVVRDDRDRDDLRIVRGDGDRDRFDWGRIDNRGLVQGCPPGLAKKNNGCMPPGQFKAQAGGFAFASQPEWWGFDDYRDGRYAYWNGNLVRLSDTGGIGGYLPLLGGALAPGNLWPSYYQPVTLPSYYQDYYGLGAPSNYRYYDDTLFQIDPQTQAITAIAALLTGDSFSIGQPLPSGYDLYNVPYSYRDQYVDRPDAMYRYSDGYVYEVDPTTQLITAAIELLT